MLLNTQLVSIFIIIIVVLFLFWLIHYIISVIIDGINSYFLYRQQIHTNISNHKKTKLKELMRFNVLLSMSAFFVMVSILYLVWISNGFWNF